MIGYCHQKGEFPLATKEVLKEKLTEAMLSDEVTPSASRRIGDMLEELVAKGTLADERLDVMERELADIMANLSGPTVDELKGRMQKGNLGIIDMLKLWFRHR